jgi:glycosyltransferase involved in cell wall biosynthesis
MNPAVSVVVATYNYGHFLPEAVESVLGQTLRPLELIVIDDGSTDGTAAALRPYLADPRVYYQRLEHAGQAAAKNAGLRRAQAPLVAFLDADDVWLPAKLARQVALFRGDPALGMVYTRRWLIDELGQRLEYRQPRLYRGWVLDPLFRTNFVCFSSAMVRRDVLDDVGLFDEGLSLAIDYDLWLRVALRYRFDYVDAPLVKYRTGHESLSCRTEERLAAVTRIMGRFLDERGGRGVLDSGVIRRAHAETCYHIGLARRRRSRLAALPWYVRAVLLAPGYRLAWRGLVSLPLPELARRWLRRALGRPEDWSVRRPVGAAEGPAGEGRRPPARADRPAEALAPQAVQQPEVM